MKELAEKLRASRNNLFGIRKTIPEAFQDAESMLRAEGVNEVVLQTALRVLHNTTMECIAQEIEKEFKC